MRPGLIPMAMVGAPLLLVSFGALADSLLDVYRKARERDPAYRNAKPDPGDRFMRAVRARITDLNLAAP